VGEDFVCLRRMVRVGYLCLPKLTTLAGFCLPEKAGQGRAIVYLKGLGVE